MLSPKMITDLRLVSQDKEVQKTCIVAMFAGCERGTDLWEYLTQDATNFSANTQRLLWGYVRGTYSEIELQYEARDHARRDGVGIANSSNPIEVIETLLNMISDLVCRKLT